MTTPTQAVKMGAGTEGSWTFGETKPWWLEEKWKKPNIEDRGDHRKLNDTWSEPNTLGVYNIYITYTYSVRHTT